MSARAELTFLDWWRNPGVLATGPYNDARDYAGPNARAKLVRLVPRRLWFIDGNRAFYRHDVGYEIGGTEQDRLAIDKRMLYDLNYIIDMLAWWPGQAFLARRRALKYYLAVRAGGRLFFNHEGDDDNG